MWNRVAAVDGRNGSDDLYTLDLRPSASACRTSEGGASCDAGAIAAAKKKNHRIDACKIADCVFPNQEPNSKRTRSARYAVHVTNSEIRRPDAGIVVIELKPDLYRFRVAVDSGTNRKLNTWRTRQQLPLAALRKSRQRRSSGGGGLTMEPPCLMPLPHYAWLVQRGGAQVALSNFG